jgi:hypothetical protein
MGPTGPRSRPSGPGRQLHAAPQLERRYDATRQVEPSCQAAPPPRLKMPPCTAACPPTPPGEKLAPGREEAAATGTARALPGSGNGTDG